MKTKIRYYISHYDPIYSGAGKSLEKLMYSLDHNKFSLEVITAYKKGLERIEERDKYKIIRVGGKFFKKNGYMNILGKIYFSISSAVYNFRNNDYDVICFIGVGIVSFPSIKISKFFSKKIINKITAVGDDDPRKLSKSIMGRSIIRNLKNARHWIISKEIYDICIKYSNWDKKNLYFITNPVNVKFNSYDLLSSKREEYKKDKNRLDFLFVGVLNERKGIDVLLDIWNNHNIEANLMLCGPRGNDIKINTMLDSINKKNIIEYDEVDFDFIMEKYLSSDYFIFPSNREGLPNVVLEAMSFGIPIIANNIPGVTDFLLGENRGILINNNQISSWTDILQKAINHNIDTLSISSNAYDWISKNSEFSIVRSKIQKMYTE